MISIPEPVIAVLPEHVIDQIAAGEVIERPASVVKELVDNAIDSGARAIVIETTGGGRGVVRVSDDGCGMSARDAVLAFERHATSKLRTVDDLWGLVSMGFRGEALPSIASVSRMSLTTRRHGDMVATRVEIEGGKLVNVSEVGAPVGTTVEVVDLLFNVPARLKFLKGDSTEATHITDLVSKFAMAHPALHLRLRHNGRTALELPPERDGFARAQSLLGPRVASLMIPASGGEDGIQVAAYLGAPELAQTTTRGVQIFVGRRAVRDRGLLHAITMGYGELIPRGRYPVAVLLVEMPPGTVDVNVHPQKIEVRFSDANAVAAAVRHVVQTKIAASAWRQAGAGGSSMMTAISSSAPPALPFDGSSATPLAERYARELRRGQATLGLESRASERSRAWVAQVKKSTRDIDAGDRVVAAYMQRTGSDEAAVLQAQLPAAPVDPAVPQMFPEGSAATAVASSYFAKLRYLGQLDLTYLVCEADGELVLVDQHAAHERVELARLIARQTKQETAVQKLLFPVTIEVTPSQLALAGRVGALLAVHARDQGRASGHSPRRSGAAPAQAARRLEPRWRPERRGADHPRARRDRVSLGCPRRRSARGRRGRVAAALARHDRSQRYRDRGAFCRGARSRVDPANAARRDRSTFRALARRAHAHVPGNKATFPGA
jgi:DNA mismatch repair protein MutL